MLQFVLVTQQINSLGECISGALPWKELFDLAKEIGFEIPRTVTLSSMEITKPDLKEVVGMITLKFTLLYRYNLNIKLLTLKAIVNHHTRNRCTKKNTGIIMYELLSFTYARRSSQVTYRLK